MPSPALEGFANTASHECKSVREKFSSKQINPSAALSATVSGQALASPAATHNIFGYGVLIPGRCPPSETFPYTRIHNSVDSNDNNGTFSKLDHDWPASVKFGMRTGNEHHAHPQTASTSPPFSFNQGEVQPVDSTYLQPAILAPPDRSPGPLTQRNESGSDIDMTQFVDDSAYYQPMDGKDGTFHFLASERFITDHRAVSEDSITDGLHDEETQTEPHETTFEFPHRNGANRLLPTRPSKSAMSFGSENTMVAAENGAFNEQLGGGNFYSIFSGSLQGVFFQNFPLHLYVLQNLTSTNRQRILRSQSVFERPIDMLFRS